MWAVDVVWEVDAVWAVDVVWVVDIVWAVDVVCSYCCESRPQKQRRITVLFVR
jgi:hypothetical protein